MAQPNFLIDTLYYSLSGVNTVPFNEVIAPGSPYSGITVVHMTNSLYQMDLATRLTCTGYRLTVSGTDFPTAQYNETQTIQNANGMIVATSTYGDSGTGLPSTVPSATYQVINGSGNYAHANTMVIPFDNSVTPGKRVVQIYGYA